MSLGDICRMGHGVGDVDGEVDGLRMPTRRRRLGGVGHAGGEVAGLSSRLALGGGLLFSSCCSTALSGSCNGFIELCLLK